jgi:hypothetical protein
MITNSNQKQNIKATTSEKRGGQGRLYMNSKKLKLGMAIMIL